MSRVQHVKGVITEADYGGFRAIASTTDMDRDGEVIDAGRVRRKRTTPKDSRSTPTT